MPSPAHRILRQDLLGTKTGKKWHVVEKLRTDPLGSGGNFCVQYLAESEDGEPAFVKATDLNLLKKNPNQSILQKITAAFNEQNHERNVLDLCFGNKLDKIVVAHDYGENEVSEDGVIDFVFYIIFEKAESDSRSAVLNGKRENIKWITRAAHEICVGAQQLHGSDITHNDLKPSNVLCFGEYSNKLADLGRSTTLQFGGPWDSYPYAGDPVYQPPEFWGYDYQPPRDGNSISFASRKIGDLYHIGSMICFLLTEQNPTTFIANNLQVEQNPINFDGDFYDALPFIQVAFSIFCEESERLIRSRYRLKSDIALELFSVAKYLLDPDPRQRGASSNKQRGLYQFDLQSTISKLDLLAKRAAVN